MRHNFSGFTQKANIALNQAIVSAETFGHTYVGTEHLLLGLLMVDNGVADTILKKYSVNKEKIEGQIRNDIGTGIPTKLSPEYFTPRAKQVIENAMASSVAVGGKLVGTEHILIGLLSEGNNYAVKFLSKSGVDIAALTSDAMEAAGIDFEGTLSRHNSNKNQRPAKSNNNSSALDKYARNLIIEAKNGKIDPVIGRNEEIKRVIQILCRRTKNNPCLIGEPGVGKTAIIEGLAQKIADGDVPEILRDKKLYSLDLTGMVAGTKYRGDFEERIKSVVDEVTQSNDIILFIDEVHTIIGAGSAEGSTDAANILKPSLARGDFQLIGATTISEYRKNIEKDAALERRFQPVTVSEPNEEDAILILKGLKEKYEAHHRVEITDEAIVAAVKLSSRYITDRFLPDKAIDLIDEAASDVRLSNCEIPKSLRDLENEIANIESEKEDAIKSQEFERAASLRDKEKKLRETLADSKIEWKNSEVGVSNTVNADSIAKIVSSWTKVPVSQLTQEESERLLKLEEVLHNRIVGQDEAVNAISKAIRRGRVGLKDPKRPIGSFVFLGPTGVGKTELCKALADAMFGSEDMIIKFDMSEYMEKHSVSRLVGSPPGYVGFDEGGQLTERVRSKPYSVVLFDEIEKAHPDIFNILLQILEDGILTDSQGRKVDFKNTVIIMTSNIGARMITEKKVSFGFGTENGANSDFSEIKQKVLSELKNAFKPEFLNRIDDIIVFSKLNETEIKEIAQKMLDNLAKRLNNLNITLEFSENVATEISKIGFDDVYGARPLRRAITTEIEDKLSEKILERTLNNGDSVLCDFENGEFTFTAK